MVLSIGNNYTAEYQHTLDTKNRVTIPSKWRPSKDDKTDKSQFLLIPMSAGCIAVYPEDMIARIQEAARKISLGDRKGQHALRVISRIADTVVCDGQGRMTLSEKLMAHAGIEKETTLSGMMTYFEIWNPVRYEAQMAQPPSDISDDEISEALRAIGL